MRRRQESWRPPRPSSRADWAVVVRPEPVAAALAVLGRFLPTLWRSPRSCGVPSDLAAFPGILRRARARCGASRALCGASCAGWAVQRQTPGEVSAGPAPLARSSRADAARRATRSAPRAWTAGRAARATTRAPSRRRTERGRAPPARAAISRRRREARARPRACLSPRPRRRSPPSGSDRPSRRARPRSPRAPARRARAASRRSGA